MVTVWEAGVVPPRVCWKLRSEALRVNDPAVTLSVIGMTMGLLATTAPAGPEAAMVTVPV